jgi:NADPH-dependent 2,4-dienoyl-CoA reductase/sulfur reductase-like enzyme
MNSRIRLVVIGGGIAGAELVRTASSKNALDITLIEPKPRLEVQALYPEYLVGKAKVEDIVNFPGNDVDLTNPDFKPGTQVMIPGGSRELLVWTQILKP